jgi:hypothetical protein
VKARTAPFLAIILALVAWMMFAAIHARLKHTGQTPADVAREIRVLAQRIERSINPDRFKDRGAVSTHNPYPDLLVMPAERKNGTEAFALTDPNVKVTYIGSGPVHLPAIPRRYERAFHEFMRRRAPSDPNLLPRR